MNKINIIIDTSNSEFSHSTDLYINSTVNVLVELVTVCRGVGHVLITFRYAAFLQNY